MEDSLKEKILNEKFAELGMRKGWIGKSKLAVFNAMDSYANEKIRLSKNDESFLKEKNEHQYF